VTIVIYLIEVQGLLESTKYRGSNLLKVQYQGDGGREFESLHPSQSAKTDSPSDG